MDIVFDPITKKPGLLAVHRKVRPYFGKGARSKGQVDPFAPGNEELTGREVYSWSSVVGHKADEATWRVRVVPNKYPIGPAHEVVIHSPHASRDFDRLGRGQVEQVVEAYLTRYEALSDQGEVFIFCNHGTAAGASISHPHSQIMAFPVLPPVVEEEVRVVKEHYDKKGDCLYCQLLNRELELGKRVVWQSETFALLTVEGGWPYELLLLPKVHQSSFAGLGRKGEDRQIRVRDMAEALRVMVRLYRALGIEDYNYWIHSVRRRFFHWHLEMVPRDKKLAGVELGAGLMVNDVVSAVDAAKVMRGLL